MAQSQQLKQGKKERNSEKKRA